MTTSVLDQQSHCCHWIPVGVRQPFEKQPFVAIQSPFEHFDQDDGDEGNDLHAMERDNAKSQMEEHHKMVDDQAQDELTNQMMILKVLTKVKDSKQILLIILKQKHG